MLGHLRPNKKQGGNTAPPISRQGIKVLSHTGLPTRDKTQLYPPPVPPIRKLVHPSWIASAMRQQTAEARRTTILQPVEQKPQSQKVRKNQTAEEYVPDEGTR